METMLYSDGKEIRVGHKDGTVQLVPTPAGPALYVDSDFIAFVTTAEDSGFIQPRVLYPVISLKRYVAPLSAYDPLKESVNLDGHIYATSRDLLASVAKGLDVDID